MKNKKSLDILLTLFCLTVLLVLTLAACNGEVSPTEPVTEPTQPTTEAPAEPTTEAPTEEVTEVPTEVPTEAPTEEPTEPTEPATSSPSVNTGTGGGYTPVEPEETEPVEPTEPPTIQVAEPGSETNAYYENIAAAGEFSTVELAAGETVHYAVQTPGSYLELNDPEVELTVDGQLCQAEENGVLVQLATEGVTVHRLQLKNNGQETKKVAIRVLDAEGSQTNPIIPETLNFAVSLEEGDENGLHYLWTADAEGILKLRLLGDTPAEMVVTLGETVLKLSESQDGKLQLPVKPEDQVAIQVVALPDAEGNYPAGELLVDGYVAVYCDLNVEQIPFQTESSVIPGGKSVIYRITGASRNMLHIASDSVGVVYNGESFAGESLVSVKLSLQDEIAVVEIYNLAAQDQSFPFNFDYAIGHRENPHVLTALDEIPVAMEAGLADYYYSYTAPNAGVISFQIWEYPALDACKTDIVLENLTAQTSAGLWITDENGELVESGTASLPVKAGDSLMIRVSAERAENEAAEFMVYGTLYGAEDNPIPVEYPGFAAYVPAGDTLYYCGYNMQDLLFDLEASQVAVLHDGTRYEPEFDLIHFPVVAAGRMPAVFGIQNTGAEAAVYNVTLSYPVGHLENPDSLKLGTTTLTREAGKFDYHLQFTAPRAGTLTVAFDPAANWLYAVDNLTQYIYGDTRYSDDETQMAVTEVAVAAGDLVQIRVNTYNPEIAWETPAGSISFTATYTSGPNQITDVIVPSQVPMIADEYAEFYCQFYGYTLNVTGNGQTTVIYDNAVYTPNADGLITLEFPASGTEDLGFRIHNGGNSDVEVTVYFSQANVGTSQNPAKLNMGMNAMVQDEVGGEGYYYTYTATKAGTLTLTFETDTIATYSINNKIFRYTNKSGHESYRLNVREGQVITIMVNTYDPKKPNENPKGTVTFEVTLQ